MKSPLFQITPTHDGWAWRTLDAEGRAVETGIAKSRAEAAAFVVRAFVRGELPTLARSGDLNTKLAA